MSTTPNKTTHDIMWDPEFGLVVKIPPSVEQWWDRVKDIGCWSGPYNGMQWDQLWPDAKADITAAYELAQKP